jgi:hypothetical protein
VKVNSSGFSLRPEKRRIGIICITQSVRYA